MMCSSSSLIASDWRMGRKGECIVLYKYIHIRILLLNENTHHAYISHTKDRTLKFEIF